MASGGVKLDVIGAWSREKLQMLEKYLAAYVKILSTEKCKKFCREFHYIDAFAGATEHVDRETGEYIDGSPRVALKVQPPFSSYTFIEKNTIKVKNILDSLVTQYPSHNIRVLSGDCNERLLQDVLPEFPKRKGPSKLGFIFLDPYGTNLNWSTVESIGKAGVFDVFINLSVMGITRQAPGIPPSNETKERISRCMGGDDWFEICYKENHQLTLPGLATHSHIRAHDGVADGLAAYYQNKLVGCFQYVTPFKMMYSSKNSPIYALMFASQAKTAMEKMRSIFNKTIKR